MARPELKQSIVERLLRKAEFDANGCWLWAGPTINAGYGVMSAGGGLKLVHRLAWEAWMWPLADGQVIDHFRLNRGPMQAPCSRLCFNPLHLEPVTEQENSRRGLWRSECPQGHTLDNDNVRSYKNYRRCRQCDNAWHREYHNRNKARINARMRELKANRE